VVFGKGVRRGVEGEEDNHGMWTFKDDLGFLDPVARIIVNVNIVIISIVWKRRRGEEIIRIFTLPSVKFVFIWLFLGFTRIFRVI